MQFTSVQIANDAREYLIIEEGGKKFPVSLMAATAIIENGISASDTKSVLRSCKYMAGINNPSATEAQAKSACEVAVATVRANAQVMAILASIEDVYVESELDAAYSRMAELLKV